MKPLGTLNYLKSNVKKIAAQFICIMLSTCLVYLVSVLFYSSIYGTNSYGINIVKNAVIVKTTHKEEVSVEEISSLKRNENVVKVIPLISLKGGFQYNSILTSSDGNVFNAFKEDFEGILNLFNMKLLDGRLPKENSNEIVIPQKFAKQNKIGIGNYIGNDEKLNVSLNDDYKVVGIMDGPCSFMLTSNNIKVTREEALKHDIIIGLKSSKQNEIDKIFKNKNINYFNYKLLKKQADEAYKNIDVVEIALDSLIIFVLCISILHINYIVLLSRKREFSILNLIGYKKSQLYRKILKEDIVLSIVSFGSGILLAFLIANILNITLLEPKGEELIVFSLQYIHTAFLVPIFILFVEMFLNLKQMKNMKKLLK